MAIIQVSQTGAEVQAQGAAKSATVNVSGALMEMLATTYTHILLAAIREAIQNACDAAKRNSLSLSDGVLVSLPTDENPVFTVTDKGAGMTEEFMETTYLSFGSSTKSGDNGAAGGLGVGRWAAYGYIRECVIATCHESDLQERAYFQFQGADGIPQVQLAATNPGEAVGTKVSFPVKDKDIDEAQQIIAWLREIMQLTLGDSFSVDKPNLLPSGNIAEHFSETILELGKVDSSLEGVRIYPMTEAELPPSTFGLNRSRYGSLVVLTNQAQGVGGLPFKVQAQGGGSLRWESVFAKGMIIEIPMSFNVPFMPSREELKYTDDLIALMEKIDQAAGQAVVARAKELFEQKDLKSKGLLNKLLGSGSSQAANWFQFSTRGSLHGLLHAKLIRVTGGKPWNGLLNLSVPEEVERIPEVKLYLARKDGGLKTAFASEERLLSFSTTSSVRGFRRTEVQLFFFDPGKPLTLVYDDLPSGGASRLRAFLKRDSQVKAILEGERFILIKTKEPEQSREVADLLNAAYSGELRMMATSSLPEIISPRKIIGAEVVKSDGMRITYYDARNLKQDVEYLDFSMPYTSEPIRYWVCKDGASLERFGKPFNELVGTWRDEGFLPQLLRENLRVNRLYLLTPRQRDRLVKQIEDAKSQGLFDMVEGDFNDYEKDLVLTQSIKELKTWIPLEDGIRALLQTPDVQSAMMGSKPYWAKESDKFRRFIHCLVSKPRLELKDTLFDSCVAPYADVVSGESTVLNNGDICRNHRELCSRLADFGETLSFEPDAPQDHQTLVEDLRKLKTNGIVDYEAAWESLNLQFPILNVIDVYRLPLAEDSLFKAISLMYQ